MKNYLIILFTLLLVSCKTTTKIIEIPIETIKTEYIHNTDSVYIHDSVYHEITTKGDTVFDTKYKYKIIKDIKTDTVLKVDSIPVPYRVEVPIETKVNELYWYLKILIGIGFISLFGIILYLLLLTRR